MTHKIEQPQSQVLAGIARADITPNVGIYHRMWGAALHDRSTGVHRPLVATVLVLAPRTTAHESKPPMICIALDHCLLWPREMQSFLDRVSQQASVERQHLQVFFSHTHGAGLMGLERATLPGGEMIGPYLEHMADVVSELVLQAIDSLSLVSITYGTGRCSLATNRDFFDHERNSFVCGFNPDKGADDTVLVGQIVNEQGQSIGTLVNYACHPTTLAWDNTLISPDYVGSMREVVEQATGVPCFFIQGASGDVGPRRGFVGNTAIADQNGRQLGYAVLSTLESMLPAGTSFEYAGAVVSGATIGTWKTSPLDAARVDVAQLWRQEVCEVELGFRNDLPRKRELEEALEHWQSAEQAALAAGDPTKARDARAMAERATRRLTRVQHLPESQSIIYRARITRLGDAIWIPLDGEHYNVLQTSLRQRFPAHALIIGTLVNGSTVWYLPDAPAYGKGLYQEEASVLSQGSLEKLITALIATIARIA